MPRGRIVKDDTLNELASHPPKTQDDLGKVRGLSSGWKSNDIGARLMAALATAKPLAADELPEREPRRPGLTKDAALVSDLLKLLLKIRAKEAGVAAKLIARSDELEALAAGVRNGLNILSGWRFEEFGRDALDLVEGRLAFATENGKLKMSRIDRFREPDRPPSAFIVRIMWRVVHAHCLIASLAMLPLPPAPIAQSDATVDGQPPGSLPQRGAWPIHRPAGDPRSSARGCCAASGRG